uniref:C2 domain-containing protein n=1 Tax=Eptatretus burgeri TaxID=7764 RepID=A0A8C4Q9Y7_EPTBU
MDNPDKFVLCVRGCTDFVYGEHPLHQFKYVRSCIYVGRKPCLAMVQDTSVQLLLEPERELEKASCCHQSEKPPPLPVKNREANDSLWDISSTFRIKLISCSRVNADDSMKLVVKAGLFHGGELLCKPALSRDVSGCSEPNWGEDVLDFDIEVGDLPRMARLCLVLYAEGEGKTRRSKVGRPTTQGKNTMKRARKADYPIVWVNTMLFDYKDQLRVGEVMLHAWSSIPDEMDEEMLHPLGTVQGNPDKEGSTVLNISFHHYASSPLFYPPYEKVLEKAADVLKVANLSRHINTNAVSYFLLLLSLALVTLMCLCCVFLSLFLSLTHILPLSLPPLPLSVELSFFLSFSFFICLCLSSLSVSIFVCVSLCVSFSLCLSVCLFLFVSHCLL